MPTYEYTCENCGHKFELFQSITAGPIRKCDRCGQRKLKRLIGVGSGVIFKGSGFYQTDYRSDSYKKAQKQERETAEKKPATKAESKSTKRTEPDKKKPA